MEFRDGSRGIITCDCGRKPALLLKRGDKFRRIATFRSKEDREVFEIFMKYLMIRRMFDK